MTSPSPPSRQQLERALRRIHRVDALTREIINIFLTSPSEEMYADVLEHVLKMLACRFGYVGYINEGGDLVCQSLTRGVWARCDIADKSIVFPRAQWKGLWGRSLLEKRSLYQNGSLSLPEGHVPLTNALAVPVMHRGALIGQFAVAEKQGGFCEEDVEMLERVADQTAPVLHGVLERERQDRQRRLLEDQLQHVRRLETIGLLAGGIAHDFNNVLAAVLGHAELGLGSSHACDPSHDSFMEIIDAARRGVNITDQLLAFASRQPASPQHVDLNKSVGGLINMLARLLGESIEICWKPETQVHPVKMDPAQVDQLLINLCVNARDAIAGTGSIEIATQNVVLPEPGGTAAHPRRAGRFVRLTVTDSGCGIDEETQKKIFYPFFTTKPKGMGTGLGLSTVHGIAEQNAGFVEVRSQPGHGTTFSIYLPCADGAPSTARPAPQPATDVRGSETILLVDDEPAVLKSARRALERYGYRVLSAQSPGDALRLAREFASDIDLLLTDVVMPGTSGPDLQRKICGELPHVRYLFMSGYTADVSMEPGPNGDRYFLPKPFSIKRLAVKVREILDEGQHPEPAPRSPSGQ